MQLADQPGVQARNPQPGCELRFKWVRFTAAEPTRDAYTLVIDTVLALLKEPQSDEWLADQCACAPRR
jgi:hypothetical protein